MTIAELERPTKIHPAALSLSTADVQTKLHYAAALADSFLLPVEYRKRPGNVLWAVEYGLMLGLPPMAAIMGIHIVDGKPSASAGLISALVRTAGHRLRVWLTYDELGLPIGNAEIIRKDDPDFAFTATFSVSDAVTAELCQIVDGKVHSRSAKGNAQSWEKYPKAMAKHRAVTAVARDACEEAMYGLHYTPEELGAEVDEDGIPVITVEVERDDPPVPRPRTANDPEDAVAAHRRESFDQASKTAPSERRGPVIQGSPEPATEPAQAIQVIVTDPDTDEQRLELLIDEMKWMSKLIGSNVKNGIVRRAAKNFKDIPLADLQAEVGNFRAIVGGTLREAGRHREADAYTLWGTDHIAPVQVMLGNEAPEGGVVEQATTSEALPEAAPETTDAEEGEVAPEQDASQHSDAAGAGEADVDEPRQSVSVITDVAERPPSVTEVPFDGENHPFDPREDDPERCSECNGIYAMPQHLVTPMEGDEEHYEERESDEWAAGEGY